jgi:hypothetical protein
MRSVVAMMLLVGCGSSAKEPPPPPAPETKCLPVVAKECGCVYTCGAGTRDGAHWTVTHAFWKDAKLKATVEPWCFEGTCTDAFSAEVVCGGICPAKAADATCHFDASGACRSAAP